LTPTGFEECSKSVEIEHPRNDGGDRPGARTRQAFDPHQTAALPETIFAVPDEFDMVNADDPAFLIAAFDREAHPLRRRGRLRPGSRAQQSIHVAVGVVDDVCVRNSLGFIFLLMESTLDVPDNVVDRFAFRVERRRRERDGQIKGLMHG
jgi:hypothetical protein